MTKASEYGISVRLVICDGEELYEARVVELPDVVAFGDTYSEAYESAVEAIEGLQEMFAEKGKSLPPPDIEETEFSGRITLRMSKSLHAAAHRRAKLDGVSLNQWVVEAVASRSNKPLLPDAVSIVHKAMLDASNNIGLRIIDSRFLMLPPEVASSSIFDIYQPLIEYSKPALNALPESEMTWTM